MQQGLALANLGALKEHIDNVDAGGQIIEVRRLWRVLDTAGEDEKDPTMVVIVWNCPTTTTADCA
jgi:hypothetical protein